MKKIFFYLAFPFIFIGNLIPIINYFGSGWGSSDVVLFFWFDLLIIGVFAIMKKNMAQKEVKLPFFWGAVNDKIILLNSQLEVKKNSIKSVTIMLIISQVLLAAILYISGNVNFVLVLPFVLYLVFSHSISFIFNYVIGKEYLRKTPLDAGGGTEIRVVTIIIVSVYILISGGGAGTFLLVLFFLKVFLDCLLHFIEHNKDKFKINREDYIKDYIESIKKNKKKKIKVKSRKYFANKYLIIVFFVFFLSEFILSRSFKDESLVDNQDIINQEEYSNVKSIENNNESFVYYIPNTDQIILATNPPINSFNEERWSQFSEYWDYYYLPLENNDGEEIGMTYYGYKQIDTIYSIWKITELNEINNYKKYITDKWLEEQGNIKEVAKNRNITAEEWEKRLLNYLVFYEKDGYLITFNRGHEPQFSPESLSFFNLNEIDTEKNSPIIKNIKSGFDNNIIVDWNSGHEFIFEPIYEERCDSQNLDNEITLNGVSAVSLGDDKRFDLIFEEYFIGKCMKNIKETFYGAFSISFENVKINKDNNIEGKISVVKLHLDEKKDGIDFVFSPINGFLDKS